MTDLRHRLTQAAADDGVPLRTDMSDLLKRARTGRRRHRALVSGAAAATTAVVLVGGGLAFRTAAPADGSAPDPADAQTATASPTATPTATASADTGDAQWMRPVDGCRIDERFGSAKNYYKSDYHTGLDFRCRVGKPIRAITDGRVTEAGYDGAYGNKTVLTLADGTELWFAHQSAFEAAKGDQVKAGDIIGYVGSTGNSLNPHLHLEVRLGGGDPVDPAVVLAEHGVDINKDREGQWVLPVESYRITNVFGMVPSYDNPDGKRHNGLDFATPEGTPIRAVAGGTVTEAGYHGEHGNRTIITLVDGTELWFSHQSAFEAEVGDQVKAGDVIGYVGSTGNAVGPHVHLEVHPGGGDPVDPADALAQHGVEV